MKTAALVLSLVFAMGASAQEIRLDSGDRPLAPKKNHVMLLDDAALVEAGKPQDVDLRFRVDAGLHINSHAPKNELLIPTALKLDALEGQKVLSTDYPAGVKFRFEIGDGETMDVYQGDFRVRIRLIAPRGTSTLTGVLRYQACDSAACFPPRTLPIKLVLTAR